MWLEAGLAFVHLAAMLGLAVFATSQTALLRPDWFNAAVALRLVRVQRLYLVSLWALPVTGAARVLWGVKGWAWYLGQPLLWSKLALWLGLLALAWAPGRAYARWAAAVARGDVLPAAAEVDAVRRQVMHAAHAMPLIPLLAVALARGVGTV